MQSAIRGFAVIKPRSNKPRVAAVVIVCLLAVQFLAGMLVNLFVQIPSFHPGTGSRDYFAGVVHGVWWSLSQGPLVLQIHVAVGIALVAASLVLTGLALSLPGWIGIMGAAFNGASFIEECPWKPTALCRGRKGAPPEGRQCLLDIVTPP